MHICVGQECCELTTNHCTYTCRDAGTVGSLVAVFKPGQEVSSAMLQAVLQVLLGLAVDDASRLAVQQANGLPRIIKLLDYTAEDDVSLRSQPVVLPDHTACCSCERSDQNSMWSDTLHVSL